MKRIELAPAIENQIVQMYKDGLTMDDVGRSLKIKASRVDKVVARVLRKHKIPIRKRGTSKKTIKIPNNPVFLAYLAGLWDGEGSIAIYQAKSGKHKCWRTYFTIANTDFQTLKWIRDVLGCGYVVINAYSEKTNKSYYQLQIGNKLNVLYLLKAILPYVKIKKDKVVKAIGKIEQIL